MALEVDILKLSLNTLLRLVSGTYFVLSSLYCLLAFLPYTFCALIKAPPYAWMPWFVHHQAGLYWVAAGAALFANWPRSWNEKSQRFLTGLGLLALVGIYLTFHPFLPGLESNRAAYLWSLTTLAWAMGLTLWRQPADPRAHEAEPPDEKLFGYSSGLLVAFVASLIYIGGAHLHSYRGVGTPSFNTADAELALWSVISHVALAVAILSTLNLIRLLAATTPWPRSTGQAFTGIAIVAVLWIVVARFLDRAMSFDGWAAQIYAAALALTLTLWAFSLVLPFLRRNASAQSDTKTRQPRWQTVAIWGAMGFLIALALASRSLIGSEDWNGFVGGTWALLFWILLSLCVFRLRPGRVKYSAAAVVGMLLLGAFAYKGLQATEIFWGKPLGSTDDEIALKLEEYSERDASFQLAHLALGNGRDQRCGDLCRILREYTNIRENHISSGVQLVSPLAPALGDRPNIFIFVIDSMRPDYLGAYNPQQVNYTPNLDALARDSVVFKNVYTQYAGTTLSEPAIWSGALLLHTHFPQPFSQVNSLQTLARTDNYQTVISYDSVLRELFAPSDEFVRLDTDKERWNQYEVCSTLQQLESVMNGRKGSSQPILFYTQPMNVHQFAHNDVPLPSSRNWQGPAGLNSRITYEVHWVDSCLGQFVGYLKQRGMYDDSIIVVTSDHGDATGEYGRTSHSVSIWPEIMHVPLIVHLPAKMREHLVFNEERLSTLTDIAPTLYYLLGHRPIRTHPLYGRPLFAETQQELEAYRRGDLLLASDVRAVYGILTADGRYLYVTYDSPAESYLFDLNQDPNARHNIVTAGLKQEYDEEIIEHLHQIADYYGYKPGVGSLLASAGH